MNAEHKWLDQAFTPADPDGVPAEDRQARALEYIAYQMGEMRRDLDGRLAAIEKSVNDLYGVLG